MRKGTLIDPTNIAIDISNIGHLGNGDYRVELYNKNDIDKIIPLIKKSLEVNKK